MKLSLPALLFFASIATPGVFCHGSSEDDKPKDRRRAASGIPPAHEKRNNFGTNNAGNTTTGADGTRTQTQENGYQARIVGGTQASPNEYPYYGK
jgi:hypothetical protein